MRSATAVSSATTVSSATAMRIMAVVGTSMHPNPQSYQICLYFTTKSAATSQGSPYW